MCLIGWAWRPEHPYPLWLAANRDEAWDRPTAPLARWRLDDGTVVLSGRDRRAGGAWLAFGQAGRLAMLTNVRTEGPARRAPRSRGELVVDWLRQPARAQTWTDWLRGHPADAYEGCNLVLVDGPTGHWRWLTNVDPTGHPGLPDGLQQQAGWWSAPLEPGVHTLSNAALDTPWPKARLLHHCLQQVTDEPSCTERALCRALQTAAVQPVSDGSQLPLYPWLQWPQRRYGTRSSLVVRIDRRGVLQATEWTYAPQLGSTGIAQASVRRRCMAWWGMPTSS